MEHKETEDSDLQEVLWLYCEWIKNKHVPTKFANLFEKLERQVTKVENGN